MRKGKYRIAFFDSRKGIETDWGMSEAPETFHTKEKIIEYLKANFPDDPEETFWAEIHYSNTYLGSFERGEGKNVVQIFDSADKPINPPRIV